MKRIPAVLAAVAASAALATAVAVPALASAAPRAGHAEAIRHHATTIQHQVARELTAKHAKHAKPAQPANTVKAVNGAKHAKRTGKNSPVTIISQYDSGQYVTVVTCDGGAVPVPVRLNQPRTPLHVSGDVPARDTRAALARPRAYHKIYTCTVTVEKKAPVHAGKGSGCELPSTMGPVGKGAGKGACARRTVTLNTGFGGRAGSVAKHHPAHPAH